MAELIGLGLSERCFGSKTFVFTFTKIFKFTILVLFSYKLHILFFSSGDNNEINTKYIHRNGHSHSFSTRLAGCWRRCFGTRSYLKS